MKRLAALLALSYPLVVHVGITHGVPLAALGMLALLVVLASWANLSLGERLRMILVLVLLLLLIAALKAGDLLLYAMPVLIQGSIAWVFARSLRSGSTPLITRYALRMGAQDTPDVHRYTRAVTVAWALTCFSLALTSLALGAFASPQIWSLFANGLSYLLLAGLFVLEYPVRRWVLGAQTRSGFLRYLGDLVRVDHRQVLRCP